MLRLPPRFTRPVPHFPYTTLFRSLRHRSVRRRRTGVSKQLSAIFRHPLRSRDRRPLLYELRTGAGRCGGADQPPSGRISVHALHRHRAGLLMSEDDISMAPTPFEEGEDGRARSEEHTSELQSLMRISYAVSCLKKKKTP